MSSPTFTTKIDGKTIVVTLAMNGKKQDAVLGVWTQYGPIFGATPAQMAEAKARVDEKIASMTAIEFGGWLRSSGMKIKINV